MSSLTTLELAVDTSGPTAGAPFSIPAEQRMLSLGRGEVVARRLTRRLLIHCGDLIFGRRLLAAITTKMSTGTLRGWSFRPSCSSIAVKIEDSPSPASASGPRSGA